MSDIGADVLAEWRVVPEYVAQMLLRRCLEIYPIVIFYFIVQNVVFLKYIVYFYILSVILQRATGSSVSLLSRVPLLK